MKRLLRFTTLAFVLSASLFSPGCSEEATRRDRNSSSSEGDGGAGATGNTGEGGEGGGVGEGGEGGGVGEGGGGGEGGAGVCGDGIINAPAEECDDGNDDSSDRCNGCVAQCLVGEQKWAGNHHCYREFIGQKVTFTLALQACASTGGYLVSITSQAEQNFVYTSIVDTAFAAPRWLGLTDLATEGTFVWTSGEPFGFTNWLPDQPDNYMDYEDCVELSHDIVGKWNDDNCDYEYYYICEYDPVEQSP